MQTLALQAGVDPPLPGAEGEAGDVLVRTAGLLLALRAAGRVSQLVRSVTLTLQLSALQPARPAAAVVAAVNPLRPLTEPPTLQSAVQRAGRGVPRLTLAPVTAGRVDTAGRQVAGRRPRLALVNIPAGGGAL